MPLTPLSRLALALICVTLAACGGGGGGAAAVVTPPAASTPTTPAAALSYSGLASSVPPFGYDVTDNMTAATLLNAIRLGAGAGLVAQSSTLDLAAKNHTSFLVNNALVANGVYLDALHEGVRGGHYEDPAKAGYSGKTPQDRATGAGYVGTVSELVGFGALNGADCVASLENSVYHLAQILAPFVELGVSVNPGNGGGLACAIELGYSSKTLGQLPAAGSVVIYPYAGQSQVAPVFYNHAEAPVPAADLLVAGHPVAVSLYSLDLPSLLGSDIVVRTFTLTSANGAAVDVRVLAKSGVSSTGPALTIDDAIADAGVLFLLPVAPLAPNSVYRVTFAATVKGRALSKDWSFTTGNTN